MNQNQYLMTTATEENKVMFCDRSTLEPIGGFAGIDRPRGMLIHDSLLYVATWDGLDVYNHQIADFQVSARRGDNNHDLYVSPFMKIWVVAAGRGIMAYSGGSEVLKYHNPARGFTNTMLDTLNYTTMTRLRRHRRGRDYDRVIVDGKDVCYPHNLGPGRLWNRPHHVLELSTGDVLVCNSGAGEVINLSTGQRVVEGRGYLRGIFEEPETGTLIMTETSRRGSSSLSIYGGLLRVEIETGKIVAEAQVNGSALYGVVPYSLDI